MLSRGWLLYTLSISISPGTYMAVASEHILQLTRLCMATSKYWHSPTLDRCLESFVCKWSETLFTRYTWQQQFDCTHLFIFIEIGCTNYPHHFSLTSLFAHSLLYSLDNVPMQNSLFDSLSCTPSLLMLSLCWYIFAEPIHSSPCFTYTPFISIHFFLLSLKYMQKIM